jgi:6-phosphogluconolactonase (cycloisomerase 2 family)
MPRRRFVHHRGPESSRAAFKAGSAINNFLAVTNYGSKTLAVYCIDADGGLERMTTVDVEDRLLDVVVR